MQKKASEAELAAQAVLLELNQLRGAAILTTLRVRQPAIAFRPAEKAESLIQASRTNNFDYRIRASELAQQGIKVALAKNERFPTISVGPSYSEENAFERERIAGVGISLPLPLWNRNSSNIDTAAARKRQAETMLLVTEREIARKILESLNVYESKLREMEKWRPDAIEHFREAAEIADRHYRLGAVPVSVYVEMQKQYLEAVTSLLDTRKEALEAAQTLELIAGPFGPLVHISDKGD